MAIFFGRLESTKNVNVHRQARQFLLDNDDEFSLELARKTILAKISNQLTLLRRYNRDRKISAVDSDIKNIYSIRKKIFKAKTKESLMGFEGYIAKCYFDGLSKIVPDEFRFNKRNKRPPKDPVNSLLSFGYTLLMYEIYTAISNYGLHPYFGFLHKLKEGHPALASDLMETWRAIIVDSMVMKMVMRNEISLDDFNYDENSGGVFVKDESRKKFLKEYENKMRSKSLYEDEKLTFRDILDKQVGEFASCIQHSDLSLYEPIVVR